MSRRIGKIEKSVARSVKHAWWLDPDLDAAAIDTARRCAEELDRLHHAREQEPGLFGDPKAAAELMTKVAYATTMLYAELARLGLTPEARRSWAGGDDDGADELADLADDLLSGPWGSEGDSDTAAGDAA